MCFSWLDRTNTFPARLRFDLARVRIMRRLHVTMIQNGRTLTRLKAIHGRTYASKYLFIGVVPPQLDTSPTTETLTEEDDELVESSTRPKKLRQLSINA